MSKKKERTNLEATRVENLETTITPVPPDSEFFGTDPAEPQGDQTVVQTAVITEQGVQLAPEQDPSGLDAVLNLPPEPSAYQQVAARVLDPGNQVTPEERQEARALTGASDGSIKKSLVSLIAGNFSKIESYDQATQTAIRAAMARLGGMEPAELIMLISTLTKASASEAKNLMELFKKNDGEVKKIILEVQGPAAPGVPAGEPGQTVTPATAVPMLRPEVADGLLRMVANLQKRKADSKAKKTKSDEMADEVDS